MKTLRRRMRNFDIFSDEPPPRPPGPPLSAARRNNKNWRLQNQLKQRQLMLGRRRVGLANAANAAGLLKKRLGAAAALGQNQIGRLNPGKLGTDDSTNVMTRYSFSQFAQL